MSVKILKKNCHQVLGSQKSKLTPPELVFQAAGAINPPPTKIGLSECDKPLHSCCRHPKYDPPGSLPRRTTTRDCNTRGDINDVSSIKLIIIMVN